MSESKNRRYKIFFWSAVFCVLIALLLSLGAYFVIKKNTNHESVDKSVVAEDLLTRVGRLVVLPGDEEPTIATVTDLTELQKQEFFRQAQVGDKVIIYAKAGKAILYSPSQDKIIEMAPINKNLIDL